MILQANPVLSVCLLVCLLASDFSNSTAAAAGSGQEKNGQEKDSPDKDYAAELPRISSKSPEDSLAAMQLKPGFHAELVAAEPLIRSPMAMDFDEYGRAYVVELPEYNQYASEKPHGKGSIRLLEDTDNDGRYDKSVVYVDNLDYPTGVACWDGGLLIGAAPDLLFVRDTDGDGKADVRRRLFTGFGQDKAGEGMLNSFRWRFDNLFHIPTGLDGGEIVPADAGDGTAAEKKQIAPLNVRGQHLLLEPRSLALTLTSGGGQHGMSLDDWCLRSFVCGNSEPVHLIMYDGRYLSRNPFLQAPAAAVNIAPDGKFTKLMRISEVEPWRVLRTRLRSTGVIPGSDEGGSPSGFFTGATGITAYRGNAWPVEYRGQLFVGEVANNLVYRARLEPAGVGLTAHRADAEAEFLASKDNWFRPVQFANAPDGTLYVMDMYRELIEGAAFLAPQILKHMDPASGADMGRIYRIAPDGFRFEPIIQLGKLSSAELVPFYEHQNGWHRDTASRLIFQRQDADAIAPLRKLAETSDSPLARIMALYSLQGLSALQASDVLAGLKLSDPPARVHALRLAESFVSHPELLNAVVGLAEDDDLQVRYQAAFTLGAFNGTEATRSLAMLALREGADPWFQLAVMSSAGNRRPDLMAELLATSGARSQPHIRSMLNELAVQTGAAGQQNELALVIRQLDTLAAEPEDRPLAEALVRSLVSRQSGSGELLSGAAAGKTREILARMVNEAAEIAGDETKDPDARTKAIRTLAASDFKVHQSLFSELLQSQQPQPVQSAAMETLARFEAADIAELIVSAWPSQTPQLRSTSLEILFSRPVWINVFLDAVEKEVISRTDVDPVRSVTLTTHRDSVIRDRAKKLFAGSGIARRQDVVDAYQKALDLIGDVDRGRVHFRKTCAACHKLEGFGESIGADLKAIRDRGTAAVLLNVLDPNREVKPQFLAYVLALKDGRSLSGMIAAETANSLTLRKPDNTTETVLRIDVEELRSTGLSFMPEGLEKQLDVTAMADVLAYLNSIQ